MDKYQLEYKVHVMHVLMEECWTEDIDSVWH